MEPTESAPARRTFLQRLLLFLGGGAGLAGVFALRDQLAGKTVAVVLSGANADATTLRRLFEVSASA